jgi:hypothetical protein
MSRVAVRWGMSLVVVLAGACAPGSVDDVATTTLPATSTTTSVSTTLATDPPTTAPTSEGSVDAIYQQCLDAVIDYLKEIEDDVASVDFATASLTEYQLVLVALLPAQEALYAKMMDIGCFEGADDPVDFNSPAGSNSLLMDLARMEAPGVIPYLELTQAMADLPTGDCRDNIAALQAYVDRGGTVSDLSVAERIHAFNLTGLILQWCSLQTGHGFVYSSAVTTFLEIEG